MAKTTRAPWHAKGHQVFGRFESDGPIATVHFPATFISVAEQIADANARLIAAAPEMLEALEAVHRAINSPEFKAWERAAALTHIRSHGLEAKGYEGEQFIEKVEAAIAKARNEDADD